MLLNLIKQYLKKGNTGEKYTTGLCKKEKQESKHTEWTSYLISWCLPNPMCDRSHHLSIVTKLSSLSMDRYCSKEKLLLGPQRYHLNLPHLPRKISSFLICREHWSMQWMCHSHLSVFWRIYDHAFFKNSWIGCSIMCYYACGRKKPETVLFTENMCCLFFLKIIWSYLVSIRKEGETEGGSNV